MMNRIFYFINLILLSFLICHCDGENLSNSSQTLVYGCTDRTSSNFDSTANENDGSCIYCDIDTTYTKVISGTAGYDIIRSGNCSFVICGIFGSKTMLLKIDESGDEIWSKSYGEISGEHWGNSVNTTSDGGYIIGGKYNIIKTDSNGIMEWYSKLSYSVNHFIEDVIETSEGDYIVVGGAGGDPLTPHNQKGKAYILRMSEGGDVQWIKRFGTSNTPNNSFWGVVQADDGGFVLAGNKLPARTFEWYDKYWVVKTDAGGNIEWSHELGGNYWDEAQNIVKLSDDTYILVGKKSLSKTNLNLWVMRVSSSGDIIWQSNHGGGNYDTGTSLTVTENEDIIVAAGYSRNSSGSPFNYRIWGIDANSGQLLWNKIHGGNQEDESYGVAQGYDNGYMVVGKSYSFGSDRVNWLVKTDSLGRVGY